MTAVGWLWIGFAAMFALVGLILLVRAMFADRSRGRRRCPKCWYDMTGATSLRCTECGRVVKHKRRLYRTRRHWRAAVLGVLLIVTGLGLYAGGEVLRDGWIRATPTGAYIAALPWLDQNTTLRELNNRINNGELRQWEYRLLVQRCIGLMRSGAEPQRLQEAMHILEVIETLGRSQPDSQPWASWALVSQIAPDDLVNAIGPLINDSDPKVCTASTRLVAKLGHSAVRTFPALLGKAINDDKAVRLEVMTALTSLNRHVLDAGHVLQIPMYIDVMRGQPDNMMLWGESGHAFCRRMEACGEQLDCLIAALLEGSSSRTPLVRALSVYGLAAFCSGDPLAQDRILALTVDPDECVRMTALSATSSMAYDDRVRDALRHAIQAGSRADRITAVRVAGFRGHHAKELLGDVQQYLAQNRGWEIDDVVMSYLKLGGDSKWALDVLLRGLDTFSMSSSNSALWLDAMMILESEDPSSATKLERFMNDSDPRLRVTAAAAYLSLGGERIDQATRSLFPSVAVSSKPAAGLTRRRQEAVARRGRYCVDTMCKLLRSEDAAVRANAAWFVGESWGAGIPALSCLCELTGDPDPMVASSVQLAIKKIEWARDHPDWQSPE